MRSPLVKRVPLVEDYEAARLINRIRRAGRIVQHRRPDSLPQSLAHIRRERPAGEDVNLQGVLQNAEGELINHRLRTKLCQS